MFSYGRGYIFKVSSAFCILGLLFQQHLGVTARQFFLRKVIRRRQCCGIKHFLGFSYCASTVNKRASFDLMSHHPRGRMQ